MIKLPFSDETATREIYRGPIRAGQFGQTSSADFSVWQFPKSELAFLQPFPTPDYSSAGYRESVNGAADVDTYFRLHTAAQPAHLALIRAMLPAKGVVADCGCGGGALLDLIRKERLETLAIEPFVGFHPSLRDRGHQIFPSVRDAVRSGWMGKVDLAVSFHVIEHTEDPVAYLREIGKLLRPGGRVFVLTPNANDILLRLDFRRFAPFFYRVVHNFYFNAKALAWSAEAAGFRVRRTLHYHEFGLANAMHWLRDGRPMGDTPLPGIDAEADRAWKDYLQKSGQANTVAIELENPA